MKILILTSSFPRDRRDIAGLFISELAGSLHSRGITIKVIAPQDGSRRTYGNHFPYPVSRFGYLLPRSLQNLAYGDGIPDNLKRNPLKAIEIPFFIYGFLKSSIFERRGFDLIHAHWLLLPGLQGS